MLTSRIKAFLIIFAIANIIFFVGKVPQYGLDFKGELFMEVFLSSCFLSFLIFMGFHKPMSRYFDNKYYKKQDEINFQNNLRREVQRKRALSEVDNENLHYQNQLRIEYIAQIAQIQLQSNQYLANMYQQAIISNSNKNELIAQNQLLELEKELKKQGLL